MASEKQFEKIKNEATCSICLDFYEDPVILDCGHNFCRACILQCWDREPGQGKVTCPECRTEFLQRNVRPNRCVSNIVESVRKLSQEQREAEAAFHCREHDEKLKLFCSSDQRAICVVCAMSRDHRDHAISPIKEAAELCKEKLQNVLDFLQKQIQEISECQNEEEGHLIKLKSQGDKLRQRIASEFDKLHKFLHDEEQALKKKLEEKERALIQQIEENLEDISEQRDSINQTIVDIQKKLKLQEMELLQDDKSISDRSSVKFKKPKPCCSDLRLVEFTVPLEYTTWKQMLKLVKPVPAPAPASLILDAKTANPWLFLSDDCRTVTVADRKRLVADNPERFSNWRCILGSEGFTSGIHYWDVYVGDMTGWGVGVASESVPRKELYALNPKAGVWAVELWSGIYKAHTLPSVSLNLKVRPQTLLVCLDYEGGQVSICNADDMSDLCTFTDTFTEKIYPFFSIYCTGESLKLLPSRGSNPVEMASLKVLENMKDEAVCSICLDFYNDPVTIDCGHNFCRDCILNYWKPARRKVTCPQCRTEFSQRNVRPNHFVSNIVENVRKLELDVREAGADLHCVEHDEKLKLFCKDDQRAICVVCATSQDHKGHAISPVKEAADLYKEMLQKTVDSLQKQMKEICQSQKEEEADLKTLKQQSESLRKNIESKFNQLHQFLHQEEASLKAKIEQKEKTILQKIKENLDKIAEGRAAVERTMTEMQRRLTLQEAEFLQGIKPILDRSIVPFQKPARVFTDLDLGEFNGPLQYAAWKRMLKLIDPVPAALNLDPDTAHPKLILSDNWTSVRFGDIKQQVPDKAGRFLNWHIALASQGFKTGRHLWEVEVGKNSTWAVGVAKNSVPRKKDFSPEPKSGVWALWRLKEEYTTLMSPRTALPIRTKPQKLCVYLDYESGQVSLYDADDMSHLYTFTDRFTEKVYPFLLTGCTRDPLKFIHLQL
ncbi:nuclear factor 7, brain-like [Carcharodon carcharias]|uniref:nuclear factor 7, brain-like n=1 Tax=Carcharodon carcharias TaxID=13397 RepID=UPI001B7DCEF5|nr:nuclear factor 7, brain-like [Carcharodon carcharias]